MRKRMAGDDILKSWIPRNGEPQAMPSHSRLTQPVNNPPPPLLQRSSYILPPADEPGCMFPTMTSITISQGMVYITMCKTTSLGKKVFSARGSPRYRGASSCAEKTFFALAVYLFPPSRQQLNRFQTYVCYSDFIGI